MDLSITSSRTLKAFLSTLSHRCLPVEVLIIALGPQAHFFILMPVLLLNNY